MLKRLFSYFIPVNIYRKKSAISKTIEINWNNGELVLDSQNTNYSYGSLQRILRKGLKTIGFEKTAAMDHILVLGVAGGSVIKTLVDEAAYKGRITGVEIDEQMVAVSNTYFHLDKIANLDIVIDDAFEFVLKTKDRYDMIIIDVFEDMSMPNFLFERFFINRIGFLLKRKGFILFNTMILNPSHEERNRQYCAAFDAEQFKLTKIPRLEEHNELILAEKI